MHGRALGLAVAILVSLIASVPAQAKAPVSTHTA